MGYDHIPHLVHFHGRIWHDLLLTGSEERGVWGIGSIPVAILPSCQYMIILHHNCIDTNTVG